MITAFDKLSDGNKWGTRSETSAGAGMSIHRRTCRDLRSGAEGEQSGGERVPGRTTPGTGAEPGRGVAFSRH